MTEEFRRRDIRIGSTGFRVVVIEEPRLGFNSFQVECAAADHLRAAQLVPPAPRARVRVQIRRGHPRNTIHLFVSAAQFDDAVGLIERAAEEAAEKA